MMTPGTASASSSHGEASAKNPLSKWPGGGDLPPRVAKATGLVGGEALSGGAVFVGHWSLV